ncbi:MAG TPA: hypothetical protein VMW63_09345 [Methanoregulaceae archaeon]|nr:hypothetical protein [Methanoregulaceae archaeon]
MKCPICGDDCVKNAHEIIDILPTIFSRCPDCRFRMLDKKAPLPNRYFETPCKCGKRFIDEVYAHIYVILVEEGIFNGTEPISAVGSPLVHPGFFMKNPPFLPKNSLVLLSRNLNSKVSGRIVDEVPEIRAVIRSDDSVPGISDIDLDGMPDTYTLLAGCDIRANVFDTSSGPIVLYKQQSTMHIEFPRRFNPKIKGVGEKIAAFHPEHFIDACCGAGTLGLTAARMGVPHVIMNDAWYAAAFWAAYNIQVNREYFKLEDVRIVRGYEEMKNEPVVKEPKIVAEATGTQNIEVYQADFARLYSVLPDAPVLAVIDLFEKSDKAATNEVIRQWREHVAGEVFIP